MTVVPQFKYLFFWAFVVLVLAPQDLAAQGWEGLWEGKVFQQGLPDTFAYQLNLTASGSGTFQGIGTARKLSGPDTAAFECMAFWDGNRLMVQELLQVFPPQGIRWCLKYAALQPNSSGSVLSGSWKADGCAPGVMVLQKAGTVVSDTIRSVRTAPFSPEGAWTGVLSQSDRDYGFYYSLQLDMVGTGSSYIVSEDNGGDATHELQWEFMDSILVLKEIAVLRKNDPRWKWCMKSATLRLSQEPHRYVLQGRWSGYLEGEQGAAGSCAPGRVTLEKPILSERVEQVVQSEREVYNFENQRKVKVTQVLEVAGDQLNIRVWDNGTVDGDIITIFLNGNRLVNRYRVTKTKRNFPVVLDRETNFLILHADDLGEVSPNTVGVAIDDGQREQVIIMSSNLSESGAVLVRQIRRN